MNPKLEHRLEEIEGFELRQYLDGAKLIDWLKADYPDLMEDRSGKLGDAVTRRLYEWSITEHPVHWSSADSVLIRMGLHLDQDVPDRCWLQKVQHFHKSPNGHLRDKGVALIEEGKATAEIKRELGVKKNTVLRWRNELEFQREAERRARERQAFVGLEQTEPGVWERAA